MQEFVIAMENETGEVCFYYLFNFYGILLCRNNTLWVKLIFAFMHALCVDNTGQFMHGSFIVFSAKMKEGEKDNWARCPQQVCKTVFCLAFISILKMIDF